MTLSFVSVNQLQSIVRMLQGCLLDIPISALPFCVTFDEVEELQVCRTFEFVCLLEPKENERKRRASVRIISFLFCSCEVTLDL